jgi:hypothetical protein
VTSFWTLQPTACANLLFLLNNPFLNLIPTVNCRQPRFLLSPSKHTITQSEPKYYLKKFFRKFPPLFHYDFRCYFHTFGCYFVNAWLLFVRTIDSLPLVKSCRSGKKWFATVIFHLGLLFESVFIYKLAGNSRKLKSNFRNELPIFLSRYLVPHNGFQNVDTPFRAVLCSKPAHGVENNLEQALNIPGHIPD